MEHDNSRSGYHEPEPGQAGLLGDEDWRHQEEEIGRRSSVNMIWAQAQATDGRRGAIGYHNALPWHLSEDMQHFKELTVSHPVIMGRRTWVSMGERPLPKRDNIILSSDPGFHAPGATVVSAADDALELARQEAIPDDGMDRSEIWIIGGAGVFSTFFPLADAAYVTDLDLRTPADVFVPDMEELVSKRFWQVRDESQWMNPAKPDQAAAIPRFRYITYGKVR